MSPKRKCTIDIGDLCTVSWETVFVEKHGGRTPYSANGWTVRDSRWTRVHGLVGRNSQLFTLLFVQAKEEAIKRQAALCFLFGIASMFDGMHQQLQTRRSIRTNLCHVYVCAKDRQLPLDFLHLILGPSVARLPTYSITARTSSSRY